MKIVKINTLAAAAVLAGLAQGAWAQMTKPHPTDDLVIGSAYFGNGSQSAVTHSFVEIFNPTSAEIKLDGHYSLMYGKDNPDEFKLGLEGTIPAKGSFLVDMGATGALPVSFAQNNYKAGRLDLTGKFDQSFADVLGNKTHNGVIAALAKTVDGDEDRDLDKINPASNTGYIRARATNGDVSDLFLVNFSVLDLTKNICLPRGTGDGKWTGDLTNANACQSFAESFETLGLQPGSDPTGVNFNWYSNNAVGNRASYARIFSAGNAKITLGGDYGDAPATTAGKYYHRVSVPVNSLAQGTAYKYQISNDGVNWGEVYDYKTLPEGKFKFAAVSDVQINVSASGGYCVNGSCPGIWQSVVKELVNNGVGFIVHSGDQVDATAMRGGSLNNEYAAFFLPTELRSIPFAPLMGNHDSHCEFIYRYNLPNERLWPASCSGTDSYIMSDDSDDGRFKAGNYYYRYNNVLFIGLNTAFYPRSQATAQSYVNTFDAVIKEAKIKYAGGYDFIVVFHHKSTQTISSHAADKDVEHYVKAGFERIMTENGVSLVLSGHDHINVRSKLLVWDEELKISVPNEVTPHPNPSTYPCAAPANETNLCGPFKGNGEGTVYLTLSTASGIKYYDAYGATGSSGAFPNLVDGTYGVDKIKSKKIPLLGMERTGGYIQKPEYTVVEVDGGTMTLTTYRNDQPQYIDRFVIKAENKPNPKYHTVTFDAAGGGTLAPAITGYAGKLRSLPKPIRLNYTFDGWFTAATGGEIVTENTVFSGNATIYAKWTPITVTVTVTFVDHDRKVLLTLPVERGGSATAPNDPIRAGYTFTGWDKAFNNVTENLTVMALYKINTYTVIFLDWDDEELSSVRVEYNSRATAPTSPTRAGYTFTGWDKTFSNVAENLTVKALYRINTYTVTFNSQSGSTVASQTIEHGEKATAPIAPTRANYTFGGWYKEAACTNAWDFTEDVVTSATILYAKWLNSYTVKFVDHDGTQLKQQTVNHGGAATAPSSPTRAGYTFTEWDKAFSNVTGDLTVKALYKINTYTVSFNSQSGSTVASQTVDYNGKVAAPTAPTRLGYTFGGWYKEAACTNAWIFTTDVVTSATTLYARWTNRYTVTFNSQSGSAVASQTVDYNGKVAAPDAPTRLGYTFGGWYKEAACTNAWDFTADAVTSAVTLYAKWTADTPIRLPPQIATGNQATKIYNGISIQATSNAVVEVYWINGSLVSRQSFGRGVYAVPLGHLPNGVYIVKVSFGSEKKILKVPVN